MYKAEQRSYFFHWLTSGQSRQTLNYHESGAVDKQPQEEVVGKGDMDEEREEHGWSTNEEERENHEVGQKDREMHQSKGAMSTLLICFFH